MEADRTGWQGQPTAMTGPYRVLPAADRDLDDQAAYLASQASLETALPFYNAAAAATFTSLAGMPVIGERRLSANPRLANLRVYRTTGFESHPVFYRPIDDGTDIVRVLHAARDLGSALDSQDFSCPSPFPATRDALA